MEAIFTKRRSHLIWIIFLSAILLTCLTHPAKSYFFPLYPSGTRNVGIFQPGPFGSFGYNSSEYFADPYAYSYLYPLAYPYNAGFNVYSGNYAYNANNLGFYNTGAGNAYYNTIGYPQPYALYGNQAGFNQAGFLGMPLAGNAWSIPSLYYDPGAFTFDLGLSAYYTGIGNFWRQVAKDLNEEEEE